ncbi:disulfide bond formation protein B [Pseudomonas borbori]
MPLASSRTLFLAAFLGCMMLMGAAMYLQYGVGLKPCPLCVIQRVCVIAFGLICLAAAVHVPQRTGRRLYALLGLVFAGVGAAIAVRQIGLQRIPADQLPGCLPSIGYMLETLPLHDVVRLLLQGTAACAEIRWTLFGLSVPEWSLLGFVAMLGFALLLLLRRT